MSRVVLLVWLLFSSAATHSSCVILLHGLARSNSSMKPMENALQEKGYKTVNLDYPSRHFPIKILSEKAIGPALEQCGKDEDVSFVTHSLGGILVRQYLKTQRIDHLKYVVMLGPPNQGSEVVDKLRKFPGFYFLNGEAGLQLGTGSLSVPNSLGSAHFNVGVIAGTKSINWILSLLIPGVDDGKVSLESAKLDGMNDYIELPTTHPFMMKNKTVISQVIYYLENGQFRRELH